MLKPFLCIVAVMMFSVLTATAIRAVSPDSNTKPVPRRCQSCKMLQQADITLGVWNCHRCGAVHFASVGVEDEPSP